MAPDLAVLQEHLRVCQRQRQESSEVVSAVTEQYAKLSSLSTSLPSSDSGVTSGLVETVSYLKVLAQANRDADALKSSIGALKGQDSLLGLQRAIPELCRIAAVLKQGPRGASDANTAVRGKLAGLLPAVTSLMQDQFREQLRYQPPSHSEFKDAVASAHKWVLRNRVSDQNSGEITLRSSTVDTDDTFLHIPWFFIDAARQLDALELHNTTSTILSALCHVLAEQAVHYVDAEMHHVLDIFLKAGHFDVVKDFQTFLSSILSSVALTWSTAAVILTEASKTARTEKRLHPSLRDYVHAANLDLGYFSQLSDAIESAVSKAIITAFKAVGKSKSDTDSTFLAKQIAILGGVARLESNTLGPLFPRYHDALAGNSLDTHEARANGVQKILAGSELCKANDAILSPILSALKSDERATEFFTTTVWSLNDQTAILDALQRLFQSLVLSAFDPAAAPVMVEFWNQGESSGSEVSAESKGALRAFASYVTAEDSMSALHVKDDILLGSTRAVYRQFCPALVKSLMRDRIVSGSPQSRFKTGSPKGSPLTKGRLDI